MFGVIGAVVALSSGGNLDRLALGVTLILFEGWLTWIRAKNGQRHAHKAHG